MRRLSTVVLVCVLLGGCTSRQAPDTWNVLRPAPRSVVAWQELRPGTGEPVIRTPSPSIPFVWTNGKIGFEVGPWGAGTALDGKPLRAWRIDGYQQSGEQKLIPFPAPFGVTPLIDGQPAYLKVQLNFYEQGYLGEKFVTTLSGTLHDRREFRWSSEISPTAGGLSLRINITGPGADEFRAKWSKSEAWTQSVDSNGWQAELVLDMPVDGQKVTQWELDGPAEDQVALREMTATLARTVPPYRQGAAAPVSPFMLTHDRYFGHVFWDADVWVFPALALLAPDRAANIPRYRLERFEQAKRNAVMEAVSGEAPLGDRAAAARGAMFPWESSVDGAETVPGPSRKQHHISGTVVFGLQKAAALGLVSQIEVTKVGKAVADFWWGRSVPGVRGREIRDVMSPDEFHIGDNDLYTNAVAQWTLDRFAPDRRAQFYFPRDARSFLTYDEDRGRGYKQAAALLTIYPLQMPTMEREAAEMFARFQGKATENGPAMTLSVEATVAARLGRAQQAHELWRESWQRYCNNPWMMYSESPKNPSRRIFVTGLGGCLQTVLYGFMGLRIDAIGARRAKHRWILKSGYELTMNPVLPPAWKRLSARGLWVLGRRYDVDITPESVRVRESEAEPGKPLSTR